MKVICTGTSGSGKLDYLKQVVAEIENRGTKIHLYNVGDLMFKKAEELECPTSPEKILDLSPSSLRTLRAAVFEEILKETEKVEHCIISTHGCFRWKNYLMPAFDVYYLNQLQPDLYITVIDGVLNVSKRLQESPAWRGCLSLKDILTWRDEEVFVTKIMASFQRKPHYIVAAEQPWTTLYNLMFKPDIIKAYLSFPITLMIDDTEKMKEVREFRDELRKHFEVFDPLAVEDTELTYVSLIDSNFGEEYHLSELDPDFNFTSIEKSKIEDQTVIRDYMLIDQSDIIIVYYPTDKTSPGVLCEILYGSTNNKEVHAVFRERVSPFLKFHCTKVFSTTEALFDYFRETGKIKN
ncbi:MAG: AAA family ATPase [Firmicutes bacterium]|mgnify:CR=1 FL=1|nr:AAA family ATPase [Bacillota bacterium]